MMEEDQMLWKQVDPWEGKNLSNLTHSAIHGHQSYTLYTVQNIKFPAVCSCDVMYAFQSESTLNRLG